MEKTDQGVPLRKGDLYINMSRRDLAHAGHPSMAMLQCSRMDAQRGREAERQGEGVMYATPDWILCRHLVGENAKLS